MRKFLIKKNDFLEAKHYADTTIIRWTPERFRCKEYVIDFIYAFCVYAVIYVLLIIMRVSCAYYATFSHCPTRKQNPNYDCRLVTIFFLTLWKPENSKYVFLETQWYNR